MVEEIDMEDWQKRVIGERDELEVKLEKSTAPNKYTTKCVECEQEVLEIKCEPCCHTSYKLRGAL